MNSSASINVSTSKSPLLFFVLVFALSSPFWLIGAVTGLQLLPGLPVSGLSAFCPLLAALMLVYKENKITGVSELLKRSFDFKRISAKVWYSAMILFWPGVMVLSFGLMRLMGSSIPAPQFSVLTLLTLFLATFLAGLGEELGWSGYAIDPMQDRLTALWASIVLGLVWTAWHLVLLMQAQQSLSYIVWQSLTYVPERVLFVWLYNNTGKSVFAVAVFHAMLNISWQLFLINGSFYDPRITGLIITIAAAIVIFLWGPKTLARYKFAQLRQPRSSAS